MDKIKKIGLATDFSKCSEKATDYAKDLAKELQAILVVIHAFDPNAPEVCAPYYITPSYTSWLKENLAGFRRGAWEALEKVHKIFESDRELTCEKHLVEGSPGEEIASYVNNNGIDMLVIGTHGYTGLKKWMMGSVAQYVVRHANCPVFVVKEEEDKES